MAYNLHQLAKEGKLDQVPDRLLTLATMFKKDICGDTPFHLAACSGCLNQVPDSLLTLKTMLEEDSRGRTIMHWSAMNGQLNLVPNRFLIPKTMLAKDNQGRTSIHWAARYGHLDQVPKELLTLAKDKDKQGLTTIHWAALYGHLDQVPERLLTQKTLLVKNIAGYTPLDAVVAGGHLDQLLGIDFGESAKFKKTAGEAWWVKNLEILRQKKELELCVDSHDVDLF